MKMDRKLISSEKHEVAYMAKRLKVSQKLVRLARERAGRSRVKVTAFVLGYGAAKPRKNYPWGDKWTRVEKRR